MNVSNRNLAILASDLITIKCTFEVGEKEYAFLASPDDGYKEGGHALVEAQGRSRGMKIVGEPGELVIVNVVSVDAEADIDIERTHRYRFAICPVHLEKYTDREEQLDMASEDVSKHRRMAAKNQIVQAMLGDGASAIRGLAFKEE